MSRPSPAKDSTRCHHRASAAWANPQNSPPRRNRYERGHEVPPLESWLHRDTLNIVSGETPGENRPEESSITPINGEIGSTRLSRDVCTLVESDECAASQVFDADIGLIFLMPVSTIESLLSSLTSGTDCKGIDIFSINAAPFLEGWGSWMPAESEVWDSVSDRFLYNR
ncbi:uncharacterized protein LOC135169156 [Diachasmimorpha longicaudata]|uniref:uncharacterized protein LOC135169156 n=1 Tax=Diachasmimorpha longicaudata TaxID=58733 RepID=UPI0030B87767